MDSSKALVFKKQNQELVNNPETWVSRRYLCTGLKIEDIYLGIDFIPSHVEHFSKIVTNTLL